jgi:hypothetical protein
MHDCDGIEDEVRHLMGELDHLIEMATELDAWAGQVVRAVQDLHWLAFALAMESMHDQDRHTMGEAFGVHRAALRMRAVIGRPDVNA